MSMNSNDICNIKYVQHTYWQSEGNEANKIQFTCLHKGSRELQNCLWLRNTKQITTKNLTYNKSRMFPTLIKLQFRYVNKRSLEHFLKKSLRFVNDFPQTQISFMQYIMKVYISADITVCKKQSWIFRWLVSLRLKACPFRDRSHLFLEQNREKTDVPFF